MPVELLLYNSIQDNNLELRGMWHLVQLRPIHQEVKKWVIINFYLLIIYKINHKQSNSQDQFRIGKKTHLNFILLKSIWWNPWENHKGESNRIPWYLMKIYGETLSFPASEPPWIFTSTVFFFLWEIKMREGR